MEFVIGEQRAVMAVDALRLADEQVEAGNFLPAERTLLAGGAVPRHGIGVVVEAGSFRQQFALIRRKRLAGICESGRNLESQLGVERTPGFPLGITTERRSGIRQMRRIGHGAEDFLVQGLVFGVGGQQADDRDAVDALLEMRLEGRQGLGPLTVAASVPIEPRAIGGAKQPGRMPPARAGSHGDRQAIGKRKFRTMATRAGYGAIGAESQVEKKPLAEHCRPFVVGGRVARVGLQRRQGAQRKRCDQGGFGFVPALGQGGRRQQPDQDSGRG